MITKMGAGLVNALFRGMRDGPESVRDALHAVRRRVSLPFPLAFGPSCLSPSSQNLCSALVAALPSSPTHPPQHTPGSCHNNNNNNNPTKQSLDANAKYAAHEVVRTVEGRGVDFVAAHLAAERERLDVRGWRIVAEAACSQDDTYFALVELRYASKAMRGAAMQPARELVAYRVVEADVMYDDTALRALSLSERGQLTPDEVAAVASVDTAHRVAAATPFPVERVKPYPKGLDNDVVLRNSAAWCAARSSGQAEAVLDDAFAPDFRLWDAYGVLPVSARLGRRGGDEGGQGKRRQRGGGHTTPTHKSHFLSHSHSHSHSHTHMTTAGHLRRVALDRGVRDGPRAGQGGRRADEAELRGQVPPARLRGVGGALGRVHALALG